MYSEAKMHSRGALMLSMARGFPVTSVFSKPAQQLQITVNCNRKEDRTEKRASNGCEINLSW